MFGRFPAKLGLGTGPKGLGLEKRCRTHLKSAPNCRPSPRTFHDHSVARSPKKLNSKVPCCVTIESSRFLTEPANRHQGPLHNKTLKEKDSALFSSRAAHRSLLPIVTKTTTILGCSISIRPRSLFKTPKMEARKLLIAVDRLLPTTITRQFSKEVSPSTMHPA